jgi:PAS domain S-box-containing protein
LSLGGPLSERALILAPTGRDGDIAAALLREAGFFADVLPDIPALCAGLAKGAAMAVIADEALRTADVRPLTNFLEEQEPWSDFPILVLTKGGGGPERNPAAGRLAELLGNVTFLERPFHPTTLVSIARSALRGRRRQYEARASLVDLRHVADRQKWLVELDDVLRNRNSPAEVSFAAAEFLGRVLDISRAGYGAIDKRTETIAIEKDWNAPGIQSLAGVLHFRDYGSYIDDLKRGRTVVVADARTDARTTEMADALVGISAVAFVNMPVTEKDDLVALLYLNHATARDWPAEELAFVREVAQRTRIVMARRQAEEDLRALATSLERQVEERTAELDRSWANSNDLQVVVAADGIFRSVSPASAAILGYQPGEMVGRNLMDFVWPEDVGPTQGALVDAATQTSLTNFENRYRHCDGSARWLSWNTTREGELIYGYGRDITETKLQQQALISAEDQLRQAQKMEAVGQLTGGLAHDFNNLLAAITGSLEMLDIRISQGRAADYERYLVAAKSSAKRAAALTHRLLAFSRRQTLDPKPVGVNRLVGGLEDLIRRTVGPGIAVEFVGAAGLWTTYVDAGQLENSLLNLCINARDAMPGGGRLTVETANRWIDAWAAREHDLISGQYVSLCVSDTGTGMPSDVIARAFDPFFTTKPMGQGTGLGLSMVYGFAKQSGGQVRIYSELGKGSTVCIYLPRHLGEGDIAEAIPEPERQSHHDSSGKKILVVDDEAIVRMLIVDVLTELGYEALEAIDGASALKVIDTEIKLDLLITDVGLPGGMNGRQVADAARDRQPDLKIMFVTGYAENAVVGNGHLDAGMHVLTKPFPIEELGRRIKEVLAQD